jgi:hypothetical protein
MIEQKRSSIDESGNVRRLPFGLRITYGQVIGDDDCPFLKRWVLIHDSGLAVRLHYFFPNHEDAVAHDHPFSFVTLILKGSYTDISRVTGWDVTRSNKAEVWVEDTVTAGSVRYRPAEHAHRTRTGPEGCWTLMANGPKKRLWGFLPRTKDLPKWIPWMKFLDTGLQRAACEPIDKEDAS